MQGVRLNKSPSRSDSIVRTGSDDVAVKRSARRVNKVTLDVTTGSSPMDGAEANSAHCSEQAQRKTANKHNIKRIIEPPIIYTYAQASAHTAANSSVLDCISYIEIRTTIVIYAIDAILS
jgi:hypothetical protein